MAEDEVIEAGLTRAARLAGAQRAREESAARYLYDKGRAQREHLTDVLKDGMPSSDDIPDDVLFERAARAMGVDPLLAQLELEMVATGTDPSELVRQRAEIDNRDLDDLAEEF